MQDSTMGFEAPEAHEGYVFDFGSLYVAFEELTDKRHERGKRYPLALVWALIVLAKLCGEDQPYGIAQWVRERQEQLAKLLGLARPCMPCHNTYRRILRDIVPTAALQEVVSRFLTKVCETANAWLISVDGKTLRGSVPAGQDKAVHLLAAYLPQAGVVLTQIAVEGKENEIRAAPPPAAIAGLARPGGHGGRDADPTPALEADCGRRGRLCVVSQEEPAPTAPGDRRVVPAAGVLARRQRTARRFPLCPHDQQGARTPRRAAPAGQ